MAWYAVYRETGKAEPSVRMIKFGFSYPAFFFTWVWALSKRLYLLSLVSFIFGPLTPLSIVSYIILAMPSPLWVPTGTSSPTSCALSAAPLLLSWGVQVSLGFYGNKIYRNKLERKNYIFYNATCTNEVITGCYKHRFIDGFCMLGKRSIYSGCLSGVLLSSVALWLDIHKLFPIK